MLPAEKVAIPSAQGEDMDDVLGAARDFQAIASHPPRPATIPAPLTRQEKFVGGAVKTILLLLFIAVLAIPLFNATQKVVDAETDQRVPWTEPGNEFSDVLDNQRRQLISEQLGIVDLQQPGSVALVSFDYSNATQGEMQPLAEAVLGRLLGQGMRVIAISLEPEGAPIAQNTLKKMADDRKETYGTTMINLGYMPGYAAAIRWLATADDSLAGRSEYEENTPLSDMQDWADISNMEQVDVVVTFADNPSTARAWIEQLHTALPQADSRPYLLAATSAAAHPFLIPYRESEQPGDEQEESDRAQLDGLISGITGAAALEAGRKTFGPARQMIDSLSIASLIIVIIIVIGTIVGWMPSFARVSQQEVDAATEPEPEGETE